MDPIKELRKPTDKSVSIMMYANLAEVRITKIPIKKPNALRRRYKYIVSTDFVFNNKEYRYNIGFDGITETLKYALYNFNSRDKYMERHGYKLSGVLNNE